MTAPARKLEFVSRIKARGTKQCGVWSSGEQNRALLLQWQRCEVVQHTGVLLRAYCASEAKQQQQQQ